jgi:hypothetical protein
MTFALVIPELAAAGQTEVDSVLTLGEVKEAVGAHRFGCCLVRGVGLFVVVVRREDIKRRLEDDPHYLCFGFGAELSTLGVKQAGQGTSWTSREASWWGVRLFSILLVGASWSNPRILRYIHFWCEAL